MKMILSVALTVVLFLAIIHGRKKAGATVQGTILVFLCLLLVTALGYYGANLVYSRVPQAPTEELREGGQLFARDCQLCHPQGGNIMRPQFPVIGSAKLSDLATFTSFIRNPVLPGGQKGQMPRFTESKISDKQMKALYDYITLVLQKKPGSHGTNEPVTLPGHGNQTDGR